MYINKAQYEEMTKNINFKKLEEELDSISQNILSSLGEEDVKALRKYLKSQKIEEALGQVLIMTDLSPILYAAGIVLLTASKCRDSLAHEALHGAWEHESLQKHMSEKEMQRMSRDGGDWGSWPIEAAGWKQGHNKHHANTGLEYSDADVSFLFGCSIKPETGEVVPHADNIGVYGATLRTHEQAKDMYVANEIPEVAKKALKYITDSKRFKSAHKVKYWAMVLFWAEMMGTHHANSFDNQEARDRSLRKVKERIVLRYSRDLLTGLINPFNLFNPSKWLKVSIGNLLSTLFVNMIEGTFIWQGHHSNNCAVLDESLGPAKNRGEWYYRQIICTNDFTSENDFISKLYRCYGGGLDAQTVHHLFPTIPHTRFDEAREKVMEVCRRHKISYNISTLGDGITKLFERLDKFNR